MKRLVHSLAFATVLALTGLMLWGVSGCSTIRRVETYAAGVGSAITGHTAIVTVEVIGATVDSIMHGAAKAYHNGDITAREWDAIAALHDRYQPVYLAEVAAIVKANGTASQAAPSPTLASLYAEFVKLASLFKLATATPAK